MRAKSEIVYQKQTNPYAQNKPKLQNVFHWERRERKIKRGRRVGGKGKKSKASTEW